MELALVLFLAARHLAADYPPPAAPSASAPATVQTNGTLYTIRRYDVLGNVTLDQATLDQVLQSAIGTNVSLPQVRRSLEKLQEAYRENGRRHATVTLPPQRLEDGLAQIRVDENPTSAAPSGSSELPQWTAPAYSISRFHVRGNTTLSDDELHQMLASAAEGTRTAGGLEQALRQLREAYRARGLPRVKVTLPQQLLTDGTAVVIVDEGRTPEPSFLKQTVATTPASDNATPQALPTFEVRQYEVEGNTLLAANAVERLLAEATGPAVTLPQIQKALGELQLAYRERGFATVSVGLPQQQLTNATVKVQVTEGRLTDIRVAGNRHFSSNNVLRALPGLRTNEVLNSRVFQRQLDLANQNRDRQIFPVLSPGPDPGTSALNLKVKDRLPLHGRLDLNNHSTPGTPGWRVNASLTYDNLWQHEHQLGLSYGFTPEAFKDPPPETDVLFNRPLIAYAGAYYRMPLGAAESLDERLRRSPLFGYDEATRQFRLPPSVGRADLTLYASGSSSDTGVKFGPANLVSQTPLLAIVSRDSGQNLSQNGQLGTRLNLPLRGGDRHRWALSAGVELKTYSLESYNTNNFIITTVVTNAQGSQTIESRVASPQPRRENAVVYLPLTLGAAYTQSDAHGSTTADLSLSFNPLGDRADFSALAYSPDTRAGFGKANLTISREQKLFGQWTLAARARAQAASGPLLSTEQFALGGANSVRGYFEGDEYGDAGWLAGIELRTPYLAGQAPVGAGTVPGWVRGSVFIDGGQRILLASDPVDDRTRLLWGTGLGLSGNLNHHLDLKIAIGWPLRDSLNTQAGDPRAYFTLGGQF